MKKVLLAVVAMFGLSGCYPQPYVDVKTSEYATIQFIPESKAWLFSDTCRMHITDFSKGCKGQGMLPSDGELGYIETDNKTPSRIAKIPANIPLKIVVNYISNKPSLLGSKTIEYTDFVLTPEKGVNYKVKYTKKDITSSRSVSGYSIYIQQGNTIKEVPASRIREFDPVKECF